MSLKQSKIAPTDARNRPEVRRRVMVRKLDLNTLRQPQGPSSGINAIIGKWPGDEIDEEEVIALIEEIS